ncbi:MAG: hypothetical protein JSW66_04955 [Phycisphaerales bacterium]|nr:MAG: hypothetical protein JSW66_04955 [Phycisphaerales bacterium]
MWEVRKTGGSYQRPAGGGGRTKIGNRYGAVFVVASTLVALLCQSRGVASPVDEAIKAIADRLAAEQVKVGFEQGSWPQEELFTGQIIQGLADAYEQTGVEDYLSSAELAGYYVLRSAGYEFFGDEALALARLSSVSDDPNDWVPGTSDNIWGLSLKMFYANIKSSPLGTEGYISYFAGVDSSLAVLSLADYVVAAYSVDAEDKEIWRHALVKWLSAVDDDAASYPVMALGAATWALATTGPSLDETVIDPFGQGASYWKLKKLEDLPGLLLSHQVPADQPDAGAFYWRFDHGNGGIEETEPSGYTEDAIFATLGLLGIDSAHPDANDPNLTAAIFTASDVLVGSVSSSGKVSERLSQGGMRYYVYGAEMLRVLSQVPVPPPDPEAQEPLPSADLAFLGSGWLESRCVRSSFGIGQFSNKGRMRIQALLAW